MTRIGFVRRIILNRVGEGRLAPLWALLAVLVPMTVRLALDPWVSGVPFLTFFPAVLVATAVLGWRWGLAVMAASALVANYAFQAPYMSFALGTEEIVSTAGFLLFGGLVISAAEALRRSVVELEERTQREAALNLELQHRVNNNLAVIQGLAAQTARHTASPEAFYPAFRERLLAVSAANRVLAQGSSETAMLPELAEVAMAPFRSKGVIHIAGPACRLPANACVPLALALHELATNATKYGAMSSPDGCVRLTWAIEGGTCHLAWREQDGPPVLAPKRQGLGSKLLRRQPGLADVTLAFHPAGVVCEILIDNAESLEGLAGAAVMRPI